jgi:hypothetical protein
VNCSISNFNHDQNDNSRFLLADDIDVFIPKQHWILGVGDHEIEFSSLHFNSKNHKFKIDSCKFISFNNKNEIVKELNAESISIKSDSFAAMYLKNEIIIDSLHCLNPLLHLLISNNDTSTTTSGSLRDWFKGININILIRNLSIANAQLAIENFANGKASSYTGKKTNLKIENIALHPADSIFLTSGNIDLELSELSFYTPDSLYKLTMENMHLVNDEIRFTNAVFIPALKNKDQGSFKATIPIFILHKMRLSELFEKRLGADVAEMIAPTIYVTEAEKNISGSKKGNLNGFYQAMHGLSELIRVTDLKITNAKIVYHNYAADSLVAEMQNFNTSVSLEDFLNSNSLYDIKHSIPYFEISSILFKSKKLTAAISNFQLHGSILQNKIEHIKLELADSSLLVADNIYWHKLNWDSLAQSGVIILDSINIDELNYTGEKKLSRDTASKKSFPNLQIRMMTVQKFKVKKHTEGSSLLTAKGNNFLLENVSAFQSNLTWNQASGDLSSLKYAATSIRASIDKIHFEAPGKSKIEDLQVSIKNNISSIEAKVPEIKFKSTINSTAFSNIDIISLTINKPEFYFSHSQKDSVANAPLKFPVDVSIDEMKVNNGNIYFTLIKPADTLQFSSKIDLKLDSLQLSKNNSDTGRIESMDLSLSKIFFNKQKLNASGENVTLNLRTVQLIQSNGKQKLNTNLIANWSGITLKQVSKKSTQLELSNFSGETKINSVQLNGEVKTKTLDVINNSNVFNGKLNFSDSTKFVSVGKLGWDASNNSVFADSINITPINSFTDFSSKSKWQTDYIVVNNGSAFISNINLPKWFNDSVIIAEKIELKNFDLDVYRDKRIPFQHGIEKDMPTKLLASIKTPFKIDSIAIADGSVFYHEISNVTNREGVVPVTNITALLRNVKNIGLNFNDTLFIRGKAQLLNSKIKKFRYNELYSDSLSSFNLAFRINSFPMNDLTKITNPLAGLDVSNGQSDTMIVRMSGNKYASAGQMQFFYHNLKINLQDQKDTINKRLSMAFVNFVANSFVIKEKNENRSSIFYIRDREKFVFNFWIKSVMSGILSSAGIKSSKKYHKQYKKLSKQYQLPEVEF